MKPRAVARRPTPIVPRRPAALSQTLSAVAVGLVALVVISVPGAAAAVEGASGPRLKFRAKGPVCACSSDLDEQAIARGLSARLGHKADAPASGASAIVLPPPSRPPLQPQEQRR